MMNKPSTSNAGPQDSAGAIAKDIEMVYALHHTPKRYGIESYISVPVVLRNGEYFGNLCAIDRRPFPIGAPQIRETFRLFAQLIAGQIDDERRHLETDNALAGERTTAELREQFIAVLGHANVLSELQITSPGRTVNADIHVRRTVLLRSGTGAAGAFEPGEECPGARAEGRGGCRQGAQRRQRPHHRGRQHGPADPPAGTGPDLRAYARGSHGMGLRQGLGLGLYISRQIVQAHGGTLEVTSSAGDGTRFVATLPVAAVDDVRRCVG